MLVYFDHKFIMHFKILVATVSSLPHTVGGRSSDPIPISMFASVRSDGVQYRPSTGIFGQPIATPVTEQLLICLLDKDGRFDGSRVQLEQLVSLRLQARTKVYTLKNLFIVDTEKNPSVAINIVSAVYASTNECGAYICKDPEVYEKQLKEIEYKRKKLDAEEKDIHLRFQGVQLPTTTEPPTGLF